MEKTPEAQPAKPRPYYEQVFARCNALADELLDTSPELEAVAFVPSWTLPNERLPPAVVHYRKEAQGKLTSGMRMGNQIVAALAGQAHHIGELLAGFDEVAGKMAEMIKGHQERLKHLEEAIRAKTEQLEALRSGSGGDPPPGP